MGYTKVKVKTRKSLEAEIEKSSVHVSALEGAMYKKKKKRKGHVRMPGSASAIQFRETLQHCIASTGIDR